MDKQGGNMSSVLKGGADATAAFGGATMMVSIIISIFIGLGALAGAIYIGSLPQQVMIHKKATVKESKCETYQSCSTSRRGVRSCRTNTTCVITIEYPNEEGIMVKKEGMPVNRHISEGQILDVKYPTGHPLEACVECPLTNTQWAIILGVISFVTLSSAIITWYFRRFKAARVFHGGATGLGMIRSALD
jgi:hypothetical protein